MAEPNILTTLKRKQAKIEQHIKDGERRLKQARHDLAHVNATIRLFEITSDATQFPAYVRLSGIFRRGELMALCQQALEAAPEGIATTREIGAYIIARRGWDASDRALAVSVMHSVVTTLSERKRRNAGVELLGKRDGVNLWRLGASGSQTG